MLGLVWLPATFSEHPGDGISRMLRMHNGVGCRSPGADAGPRCPEYWEPRTWRSPSSTVSIRLSGQPAVKLAFEFLVLTAARSAEVRLATWTEINTADRVWTISAMRMKAKREHRVPLCRRALDILDAALALGDGNPLVFPIRSGKAISASTLPKMLQYHRIAAVAHGFRSSFRDWAAEETDHPREVIEAALAHVVQNKVEAAYARSDLFERRRRLMDDWEGYLGGNGAPAVPSDRDSTS